MKTITRPPSTEYLDGQEILIVELKDLVGFHDLTGVDRLGEKHELYQYGGNEYCDVIRFVLDGVTYAAIENPSDGYCGHLHGLFISDTPITNSFPPVRVFARTRDDHEILDFYDVKNGKSVLSIGTDYNDEYYPTFVATFTPEDMSINN